MDQHRGKLPSSSSLLWEGDKPLLLPTEYKQVHKPSAFPIPCSPAGSIMHGTITASLWQEGEKDYGKFSGLDHEGFVL